MCRPPGLALAPTNSRSPASNNGLPKFHVPLKLQPIRLQSHVEFLLFPCLLVEGNHFTVFRSESLGTPV